MYEEAGPGATLAISDFNHGNPGLVGGGMLANEFIALPYLFCNMRPPGEPRWGKAHKDFQRRYYKHMARLIGPVQEIPNFSARVSVDPTVKDAWGIPVCRLSGGRHPYDLQVGEFLSKKAEAILKETGATRIWLNGPSLGLSGGQHQAGTCRMGDDPKTSVTNRYGQVHQIDNLFVADASLHVTNGGFNPVLTIMALAYWVSNHITTGWKGSQFR
jgi:choline dehydrogenase-like flavoprotein